MLSESIKKELMGISRDRFIKSLGDMTESQKGDFLYKIWNSYCECRCNESDQIFDLSDKKSLKVWKKLCIDSTFRERFGMRVLDYAKKQVIFKYLSVEDLCNMCISYFSDIYQFVFKEPYYFDPIVSCVVLNPVIKEIGILDPSIVGFDKEIINDSLL